VHLPPSHIHSYSVIRGKVGPLIEQWQRICILAERIIKRREAAAVRALDINSAYDLWAHLPSLTVFDPLLSALSIKPPNHPDPTDVSQHSPDLHNQSDTARLTNTLKVLVEVNERCWRGEGCELCGGVRQGLRKVAAHTQTHSDLLEQRVLLLL
jgi:sorting nexin-8